MFESCHSDQLVKKKALRNQGFFHLYAALLPVYVARAPGLRPARDHFLDRVAARNASK